MTCKVTHAGRLTESFQVKTGVRQGCLLSSFMVLVAIDWIMKTTTQNRRNGIQWTIWSQLDDDFDFADDLALLSHSHEQMQDKTDLLNLVSAQTGLNINMILYRIFLVFYSCILFFYVFNSNLIHLLIFYLNLIKLHV